SPTRYRNESTKRRGIRRKECCGHCDRSHAAFREKITTVYETDELKEEVSELRSASIVREAVYGCGMRGLYFCAFFSRVLVTSQTFILATSETFTPSLGPGYVAPRSRLCPSGPQAR